MYWIKTFITHFKVAKSRGKSLKNAIKDGLFFANTLKNNSQSTIRN